MKIEIKNRFTGTVILCGEYESIRDCLERNKEADLWGAYLQGANLQEASLQEASLRGANLQEASLRGANLRGADLQEASLRGADLQGANLQGANLRGANLRGANLRGAEGYSERHVFFQEVVRQQKSDIFTIEEWSIIGQICIHGLCWGSIKKRFNKKALKIFKKLSKVGFTEWEDKYKLKEPKQ